MDEHLEKRLDAIERRLLAIEAAILPGGIAPPEPPATAPARTTQPKPSEHLPVPLTPPPPVSPPQETVWSAPAESIAVFSNDRFEFEAEKAPADAYDAHELRWRAQLDKVAAHNPIDWAKLESLIGGKWLPLAGGLAVTIAVALFVKIAVDNGWLALIPGWARCSLGGLLGIALLCTGEWARRRVNDWAAVGLTVAGLGSLYISSYAAYALYQLMPPPVTLAVLAGIMVVGVVISALTSLSVVGLVSLIGAYIAPFIASSGNTGYVYLPLYWGAMLVVGQLLALTKGGTFAICRVFTTWSTLLLGAGWIMKFGAESPMIGLAMLGGTWILCHIESAWTARRAELAGIAEYSESDLPMIFDSEDFFSKAMRLRLRPLASVSLSAWASSLGVYLARESHAFAQSLTPGVIGALSFLLACVLVGPAGILNARPKSARERLAAALCVTAGTLLVATVAIALSGFAQTIALTAIGIAALGAARWLRTQVLDVYSSLVLVFAAGRVTLYDSWATAPDAAGIELLGFYLTEWAAACAGIGLAWIVYGLAAAIPRKPATNPDDEPAAFISSAWLSIIANFAFGLGIVLLGASLLHQRAAHESVACAILGTAALLCVAGTIRNSEGLRLASMFVLTAATACTVALAWWTRPAGKAELAGLVLVPQMWVACANGAVLLGFAWILGEASWQWRKVSKGISGIAVLLFVLAIAHVDSSATSLCAAWLLMCWLCLALSRVARGFGFEFHSAVVWIIVLGAWTLRFAANKWIASNALPLLHPGLWIAFALAGTLVAIQRISRPVLAGREVRAKTLSWSVATVIVWVATSLEVARLSEMLPIDTTARGAAVSVWWGVFAIVLLVVGFWRNVPLVRRCGLGLLTIAAGKAVFFDLARVALGWRAVSVLCLGLLMLGVGIVYARIEKSLSSGSVPPEEPEGESKSGSAEPV